MYGPEPIGWFEISSCEADLNALTEPMLLEKSDASERNGANGSFSVMATVWASSAVIACIGSSAHCQGPSRSCARWNVQTTSADVTGSPVENTASGRSLNVQIFPSAETFQLVARSGTNPSPAAFTRTNCW